MDTKDQKSNPLAAEAESRLHKWLALPDLHDYLREAQEVKQAPKRTGPYIAISREAGSRGGEIAYGVAKLLGWDVLDKELLDFMAERYHLPRQVLDEVDETTSNWFHDLFSLCAGTQAISQADFVVHLKQIICMAAIHGNVVFVGRGAQCLLPRERGLAVRIIASRETRIQHYMRRQSLNHDAAVFAIDSRDQGRIDLCKYYFQHDIDDPHNYDLIVNTDRLTSEQAADLIVRTYQEVVAKNSD